MFSARLVQTLCNFLTRSTTIASCVSLKLIRGSMRFSNAGAHAPHTSIELFTKLHQVLDKSYRLLRVVLNSSCQLQKRMATSCGFFFIATNRDASGSSHRLIGLNMLRGRTFGAFPKCCKENYTIQSMSLPVQRTCSTIIWSLSSTFARSL